MHLLYSLGELSTWAESVLQAFESSTSEQIHRCADVQTLQSHAAASGGIPVVFVENGFGSQKWLRAMRDSRVRGLLLWFGKTFSKEDYAFAHQHRVYAVLEGISTADSKLQDVVARAEENAGSEVEMQHLLRTLKTAIMQRAGNDEETELLGELKTVVGKLEKCASANEFVGATKSQASDTRLPLHQSAALADAMLTVADLERTGTLQISSRGLEQRGSIQFLQGKVVRAESGAVHGVKAIYRMFLWPDFQFQFIREQAIDVSVDESIAVPVRDLCIHGEKLQKEFNDIRQNVPPMNIRLELEAAALNATSRLEPDLFSCLASIVEFGKISQVLDYNDLPDVNLYKALIGLRRRRLIRVSPA